jgi:F-type H+-transporting ATPase subunit delta
LVAAINEAFQDLFDEKAGRVKAEVILPYEPDKAESEGIRKGLEKATGKSVVMDVTVDPELIGGVVAKVGSLVYDGSVRTQLENIKTNIMRG